MEDKASSLMSIYTEKFAAKKSKQESSNDVSRMRLTRKLSKDDKQAAESGYAFKMMLIVKSRTEY